MDKKFEIGEYLINLKTKDIYEICGYMEDFDYTTYKYYNIRDVKTDSIVQFSDGYIRRYFESAGTIEDKVGKYNKLIDGYVDNISELRWLNSELQTKIKQLENTERDTKE